ncbi:MAG: trypsin-like peptidase domain-containing protein [Phycisphaerae bacterium]|nr:trypsin-like peptidase domain-containing protein [Phycisphaerae bacterium]
MKRLIICLVIILSASPAWAEKYNRRSPIVEAFDNNKDAVVNIASKQVREVQSNRMGFFGDIYPFKQKMIIPSLGSGFVIHKNGYVITNAHVVEGAEEITIFMADGNQYQAKKVQIDSNADIALLKIQSDKTFQTVKMSYDQPLIGETVLAIGNPFNYSHTLTDGIVSAIHRDVELTDNPALQNLIQISAPINPGNSGGPLLDINGQLIGINVAIRQAAEGIGFAIPVERMRNTVNKMMDIEALRRISFGLEVDEIDPANENEKPTIIIKYIKPNSPAEKAGFRVGDCIESIDNQPINSVIDFQIALFEKPANSEVLFSTKRCKKIPEKIADLKTAEKTSYKLNLKQKPMPNAKELAKSLFGMEIAGLDKQTIEKIGIPANPDQPIITSLQKNSPAAITGLESHDIITQINGIAIENMSHFGLLLENIKPGQAVILKIYRVQRSRFGYTLSQYQVQLQARK